MRYKITEPKPRLLRGSALYGLSELERRLNSETARAQPKAEIKRGYDAYNCVYEGVYK